MPHLCACYCQSAIKLMQLPIAFGSAAFCRTGLETTCRALVCGDGGVLNGSHLRPPVWLTWSVHRAAKVAGKCRAGCARSLQGRQDEGKIPGDDGGHHADRLSQRVPEHGAVHRDSLAADFVRPWMHGALYTIASSASYYLYSFNRQLECGDALLPHICRSPGV